MIRAIKPIRCDKVRYQPGDMLPDTLTDSQMKRLCGLGAAEVIEPVPCPVKQDSKNSDSRTTEATKTVVDAPIGINPDLIPNEDQ